MICGGLSLCYLHHHGFKQVALQHLCALDTDVSVARSQDNVAKKHAWSSMKCHVEIDGFRLSALGPWESRELCKAARP